MKTYLSVLAALLLSFVTLSAAEPTVKWEASMVKGDDGKSTIVLSGESSGAVDAVHGTLEWVSCAGNECHSPEDFDFELTASQEATVSVAPSIAEKAPAASSATASVAPAASEAGSGSLWALILEAILWGFAMLLTPCVFPMVPMTVSFFLKNSGSKASGRFRASMYGLFIVLLYTVPICLIIGITLLFGGGSVTADIFNWLATHWLPNLVFFVVFMIFAASFFGAFEITLPSALVNKSDKNSGKAGLLGVFFMALTLVLVSFSCTGPIVGSVLIKSTQGEFWTPMVTMLAFSVAFALPFTLLALFPSLLERLPKSGGWLNSVKVSLGFIEVALGLKFLSVADQTYHWGILSREVYLAVWIVCFALLGFYLLGKIRFKYDSELKYVSTFRLALVIIDFAFVVWMIPGMFGAPLKALSGYLPPMEDTEVVSAAPQSSRVVYDSIDEALEVAAAEGKNVFVDITGHGCVNCREMEARVLSTPQVSALLDDFVVVELYTDDKTPLPEQRWVTTPEGKVLKDLGRVNSYIARTRFGVNSQPNYVILNASGAQISPLRAYDLDVEGFCRFLNLE